MNNSKTLAMSALAGVLAMNMASGTAWGGEPGTEKCAGIVKAGKNDCATSTTACHGSVTEDGFKEAWIYVPQGTCDKIVGAHITHQKAPKES